MHGVASFEERTGWEQWGFLARHLGSGLGVIVFGLSTANPALAMLLRFGFSRASLRLLLAVNEQANLLYL